MSIVSVTVVRQLSAVTQRFSKLPPRGVGDARPIALAVLVDVLVARHREGGGDAAVWPPAMVIAGAVVERDHQRRAGVRVARRSPCMVAVPVPSSCHRRRQRHRRRVDRVGDLGVRRRGVDQEVLEVAAAGGVDGSADRGAVLVDVLVGRHRRLTKPLLAPPAMVITAPFDSVMITSCPACAVRSASPCT